MCVFYVYGFDSHMHHEMSLASYITWAKGVISVCSRGLLMVLRLRAEGGSETVGKLPRVFCTSVLLPWWVPSESRAWLDVAVLPEVTGCCQ